MWKHINLTHFLIKISYLILALLFALKMQHRQNQITKPDPYSNIPSCNKTELRMKAIFFYQLSSALLVEEVPIQKLITE